MVAKDWDFDYTVKDSYKPEYTPAQQSATVGNVSWNYNYNTGDYPYPTYTYTWPYYTYTTVYMYQIFCPRPRCKGVFWGQIDQTVTCPKCKARVKINNEPPPDYEVEVTKGA